MPRSYEIKSLLPEDAAKAYPLIQTAMPRVTLEDWLAYTVWLSQPAATHQKPAGVMALENSLGYIHGLFSYSTGYGLGSGPVLNVDNFIALDTGDRAAAVTKLIDAIEDLAHDNGCATIHTHLPESWTKRSSGRTNLHTRLINAGHGPHAVKLSKTIDPG